ncbi:MAG: winged helix DNA-binding protein [Acidobacteria bacterium]|nr:winged helix DNA-binding protein [Acidobacteriota bacterium]
MSAKRTTVVKHLLLLGAYLQREAGRMLLDVDINQQQFVVLKEIQERGPMIQREICSAILFEKSNVSKIVKKLLKSGLVTSIPSAEDARAASLSVTPKGRLLIGRCMKKLNAWNRKWLEGLSEKELEAAVEVLDRIAAMAK